MTTILDDLAANSQLHWSDYLVLIVYFLAVIAVGLWVSQKLLVLVNVVFTNSLVWTSQEATVRTADITAAMFLLFLIYHFIRYICVHNLIQYYYFPILFSFFNVFPL